MKLMERLRAAAEGPHSEAADHSAALELVVAVAENDVIGRDNQLPWRLPADLRRFKALTLGKTVLMGRKTFESIGKALPGRTNLVLTRSPDFQAADCAVVDTLDAARKAASAGAALMVIGGAEVYGLSLPFASRIHLTLVHARVDNGDTFFDGWRGADWIETIRERHEADERHSHAFSFVTLERAPGKSAASRG
jgi:dihydrofolate reductase